MTAVSESTVSTDQPLDLDAIERDLSTQQPDISEVYAHNLHDVSDGDQGERSEAVVRYREAQRRLPGHVAPLLAEVRRLAAENERLRKRINTERLSQPEAERDEALAQVAVVEAENQRLRHVLAVTQDEVDRRRPCTRCQHRASVHNVGYSGCSRCDCGAFGAPATAVD